MADDPMTPERNRPYLETRDVKVVRPDAPRDVVSQQGPPPRRRGRPMREPVRVAVQEPSDTERLDFIIQQTLSMTLHIKMEGGTTAMQLDRKYIDNAISRQKVYLALLERKGATLSVREAKSDG